MWSRLIDRLGWTKCIDEHVQRDQCKLSVGTRIKALLVNIGTDRKALYEVEKFYGKQDMEVVLGPGIAADDLNDDALARSLDILFESDAQALYTKIALSTVQSLNVLHQFDDFIPVHADTTSVSVFGDYPDHRNFEIVRGYSKDHRPDLKQIIFGTATLKGLPIYGKVDRGNMDDHTWNHNTIAQMAGLVSQEVHGQVIYIADAAAVTESNLDSFHETNTHFISRLPATFSECEKLKRAAWDKEDASAAAEAFVRTHKRVMHRLQTSLEPVETREKRSRRGRPRKDEAVPDVVTQYRVAIEILPPIDETLEAWRQREATFVLMTDIRDEQRLPDEAVLRLYKEQGEVEGRFRHLKSPYHVGPIFLHRPERVHAFGYVMLLSLLLYSVFEYIIREKMAKETEPLILSGGRKSFRPTGNSLLDMFDDIFTAHVMVNGEWHRLKTKPRDL